MSGAVPRDRFAQYASVSAGAQLALPMDDFRNSRTVGAQ
jgi:hypothetical protein